jgi:hypothetical protein
VEVLVAAVLVLVILEALQLLIKAMVAARDIQLILAEVLVEVVLVQLE